MSTEILDLKRFVIENGIDKEQRKISKWIFKYRDNDIMLDNVLNLYYERLNFWGFKLWNTAEKMNGARYAKNRRLWKKVKKMLNNGKCYFLTLTFKDEDLTCSFKERRRWVTEYLKSISDYYIANIDFGEENGREHYHAIVRIDEFNGDHAKLWGTHHQSNHKDKNKLRNCDFQKCYSSSDWSAKNMSKYVTKLTSHALKDSNISNRVIYSKKINLL